MVGRRDNTPDPRPADTPDSAVLIPSALYSYGVSEWQPVSTGTPLHVRQVQAASTVLVIPWAAGESRSGYVDLADGALIGIAVREGFTESTLSLEASVTPTDEASWRRIFDGPRTVAWSNAVTGNQYRDAPLFPLRFLRFVRFRSSVPQAAATSISIRTAPSVI